MNFTTSSPVTNYTEPTKRMFNFWQIIITFCYVMGISGNLLALIFLCRKSTKPNNTKHKLMLKYLLVNDSTAVLGMLILYYVNLYLSVAQNIWYCRARIMCKVFGLGSGCVAIVMAMERWLALTKPFFYQKHVTVAIIRRSIFGLWTAAVILACMPFFGFGLYYEYDGKKCVRPREATSPTDMCYAYLYFTLGIFLCMGIVFFNIAVMRSLCYKGSSNTTLRKTILLRKRSSRIMTEMSNTSTKEELAFGRLMGLLCVIFVVCWIPELMTIPMAQMNYKSPVFFRVADIFIAVHFLLDPYVYVLQKLPTFRKLFCFKNFVQSPYSSSIKVSSFDQTNA